MKKRFVGKKRLANYERGPNRTLNLYLTVFLLYSTYMVFILKKKKKTYMYTYIHILFIYTFKIYIYIYYIFIYLICIYYIHIKMFLYVYRIIKQSFWMSNTIRASNIPNILVIAVTACNDYVNFVFPHSS